MTTLLAIETATGPCSVAVWHKGRVAAYLENAKPVMQSASLMPMVEKALEIAKLNYADLTGVACTVGPGSFTGIRVGLAAARGIAFAANVPGIGFTTLDVLAFAAKKPALAILNAGKGEVYYQAHDGQPQLGTLEEALAAGNGTAVVGNVNPPLSFPRADALVGLAASGETALPLTPFYIRPPDAKLPSSP